MAARDGSTREVAPPRWVATELGTRVISAIVLGIVTLLVTYAGGWPFSLFWLVAGFAVLLEWTSITRVEPLRSLQAARRAFGLAAFTILYLTQSPPWTSLAVGVLVLLAAVALGRTRRDRTWAFAGFAYAAVLVLVPPVVRDDASLGLVGILWMFAVVWATDIAAYFTGRSLGGPKLWPRVSPKKTWSGFFGGLLGGTLSGMLIVAPPNSLAGRRLRTCSSCLSFPLPHRSQASSATSANPLLKRHFDVKDSSHLIPGHGGVMDRVDGFWAVAPGAGRSSWRPSLSGEFRDESVTILGATGSVGRSTAEVVLRPPRRLSGRGGRRRSRRRRRWPRVARRLDARFAALADERGGPSSTASSSAAGSRAGRASPRCSKRRSGTPTS